MAYSDKELSKKLKPELIEIAVKEFALDVDGLGKDVVIAEILAEQERVALEESAFESVEETASEPAIDDHGIDQSKFVLPHQFNDDRITIVIAEGEGTEGRLAVKSGVNGRNIWIPRNKECNIPRAHYEALKNSVTTKYEQETIRGEIVTHKRHIPRYNIQVVV